MIAKTSLTAALTTLALAVAGPAMAAPSSDASAAPIAKTQRADNPNQRYCIVSDVTGSRIARKECQPLAIWQEQGIDPRLMPRRR